MPRPRKTFKERKAELAKKKKKKAAPNIARTPVGALRDLRAARRRQAEAIKRAGG